MSSDDGSRRTLEAGTARVLITPRVGIRMMGYTVQECVSDAVERELTATAVVLSDGVTKAVLMACDLVFVQSPLVDEIRARIAEKLGISAANVLINCSHTHSGPMLPGWQPDSAEQQQMQEEYAVQLAEHLVGIAGEADERREPARIGFGQGSAPIGINRRERLPDGRVIIGENPSGPVDHGVDVVRIDDFRGRTLVTMISAAAHTVVLGPKTSKLSPDYVGPAREILESATGAPCLFLQGAAGNVNPRCGIGAGGPEQYEDLDRLGALLAGEALTVWAKIRTHNRHGPRRIVQSVATVSVWDYEPAPTQSIEHFDVLSETLSLPLAPLPARDVAENQLAVFRSQLQQADDNEVSIGKVHVLRKLVSWAETVLRAVETGGAPLTRDLHFWTLRINDFALVALSGEPFAELALEVKRRSPLEQTMFLGYSNGCVGYLPTAAAFDEGGMEVEESYRNYLLPAPLTKAWEPAIVDTSLALLGRLH
jgi:hypothetical protein